MFSLAMTFSDQGRDTPSTQGMPKHVTMYGSVSRPAIFMFVKRMTVSVFLQ
jgi:hypothetical protein